MESGKKVFLLIICRFEWNVLCVIWVWGNCLGIYKGVQPQGDTPMVDTAEQVYISSLSLLKMLKHGRAGVPMEVMGYIQML